MTQTTNTILIIEDDLSIRKIFTIALENAGYKVVESGSGREGLGLAVSLAPKAILLDLSLPDMDGTEVIAVIRG